VVHRLLFVEDDKSQLSLLRDALKDWNDANVDKTFDLYTADSYDTALLDLSNARYDAALLDLRLPGRRGPAGQTLADLCVSQYGIPAAIISGHPGDYDTSKWNGMVEVFDKGDSGAYAAAVAWFGGLSHMMRILSGTRKVIQAQGAAVFWTQVWPQWKSYENLTGIQDEELIGIVSRQYASHIAEILGSDSENSAKWHPFENYIRPVLQQKQAQTGDIFKLDDLLWVVLTPQCDMATRKAKSVLLACCDPKPSIEIWQENIASLKAESGRQKKAAEEFLGRLITQAQSACHFLPPLEAGQPLMVDFKHLRTVDLSYLEAMISARVATVAPPFLPNLTQRFGAYVSRVGQPNIDAGHLS
jgi:CheY-like chemotaxis protein